MEYDIEYQFEELGLPLPDGSLMGFFDGVATITFDTTGYWSITGITVNTRKLIDGKWIDGTHSFHARTHQDSIRYHELCDAIEKSRSAQIEDEVCSELNNILKPRPQLSVISAGRTM